MSDRNSLATVRNLLSSDLRVNLPKDKECAKYSTEARYRCFAHDDGLR